MNYNLADDVDFNSALEKLYSLQEKGKRVSIKAISEHRSLNQNAYLHLLLGVFGSHFGYTLDEAKYIFKEVNKDIYFYSKKGRYFIRSTADVTKEEMTKSIDRFMQKSAEYGCTLPLATDDDWVLYAENIIEQNQHRL